MEGRRDSRRWNSRAALGLSARPADLRPAPHDVLTSTKGHGDQAFNEYCHSPNRREMRMISADRKVKLEPQHIR